MDMKSAQVRSFSVREKGPRWVAIKFRHTEHPRTLPNYNGRAPDGKTTKSQQNAQHWSNRSVIRCLSRHLNPAHKDEGRNLKMSEVIEAVYSSGPLVPNAPHSTPDFAHGLIIALLSGKARISACRGLSEHRQASLRFVVSGITGSHGKNCGTTVFSATLGVVSPSTRAGS